LKPRPDRRALFDHSAIVAAVVSSTYAVATLNGHPVLRHDWGAGPFHTSWSNILSDAFTGWNVIGIGSPSLYPDAYVVSLPIALVTALGGNQTALFVTLLVIGALAAFAGRALAKDAGAGAVVSSAASILCVFNPWTYTELVAGHVFMLLAYAASIWLFRELLLPQPRPTAIIIAAILTLQQLQFFVVTTVALVIFGAVRRRWVPLGVVALMWIPIAIAILSDTKVALESIPVIVSWEQQQSIPPLDALQATGYFAGYAKHFSAFGAIPMFYTLVLALVAFIAVMSRRVLLLGVGTLIALLLAMGLRGPLLPQMEWLTLHVRGAVLYRELFDLLAYVIVGYCALAVWLCARYRLLGWSWLAALLLLPIPWFTLPPSHYWLASKALPPISLQGAAANTRFALVPAFQPMSYAGKGSGRDPNLDVLSNNVTPLNEAFATYPTDAALGAFVLRGDTTMLRALSVSEVVERPWLRTNTEALAQQWALPLEPFKEPRHMRALALTPVPELSLLPTPDVGTLDARFGSGDIFFADAAALRGPLVPAQWARLGNVIPLTAPSQQTQAARGWVNARFAFAQRPDLAQSLGGALTTNATAVLPLTGEHSVLLDVEGALRSTDGRMVSASTGGYRWIAVPPGVRGVTCSGLCLVAAQGDPPHAPLEPNVHPASALQFRLITPWLVLADVPRGGAGALRYNTAYAKGWTAYLGTAQLTHLRLDGTINGWLIPSRSNQMRLVVVEAASAAEVLSELAVICVLCSLAASAVLRAFVLRPEASNVAARLLLHAKSSEL
jgi:hypothetical protein